MNKSKVDVILGLQWGDEGKGKIVDVFTPGYDITARFQGGPNAGHTIITGGKKHVLHTIPSGIFHKDTLNLIGNGVIIDPVILFREIDRLLESGIDATRNLLISRRAHIILPTHRLLDAALEASKGKDKIGSTLKGIGPAYTDKYARKGLRIGDLELPGFDQKYENLRHSHLQIILQTGFNPDDFKPDGFSFHEYESKWMVAVKRLHNLKFVDGETFINDAMEAGKKILAEGAQGTLLDIDFGSYPFVTSSNTITAGVCTGLGIAPQNIGRVFGIFKAYCTRVGNGPFPTELSDDTGELIRKKGAEFGATTGRPRRCGWLDLQALKYSIRLNGVTDLVIMKADVLNYLPVIKVCTGYLKNGKPLESFPFELDDENLEVKYDDLPGWEELNQTSGFDGLPASFRNYIAFIEQKTGIPIEIISVGPDREQTIFRKPL